MKKGLFFNSQILPPMKKAALTRFKFSVVHEESMPGWLIIVLSIRWYWFEFWLRRVPPLCLRGRNKFDICTVSSLIIRKPKYSLSRSKTTKKKCIIVKKEDEFNAVFIQVTQHWRFISHCEESELLWVYGLVITKQTSDMIKMHVSWKS